MLFFDDSTMSLADQGFARKAAAQFSLAANLDRSQGPAARESLAQTLYNLSGALSELGDPSAVQAQTEALTLREAQSTTTERSRRARGSARCCGKSPVTPQGPKRCCATP